MNLVAYLNFNGNAREAMEFYKSVFGGELTIQSFADANMGATDEEKKRTMHAQLKNEWLTIMASDGPMGKEVTFGTSVHLSLIGTDLVAITEYFNKLSEGGSVVMPLAQQFWGDTFGMVTDKFGIHWMANISKKI